MGKLSVDIIEDTYLSKSAAAGNNLSILIGMDRLTYLVSTADHQVLVLHEYELESRAAISAKQGQNAYWEDFVKKICREVPHFHQPYARIRIGWTTSFSAIVPGRLYQAAHKATYLQYLSAQEGKWEYGADQLPHFNAFHVYGVPGEALSWSRTQFPGSEALHAGTAYLAGARALLSGQPGTRCLFVHVGFRELRLSVMDGNQLYFTNVYTFQTAKDFLYYLLAVVDECDLDQETTPVLLSGRLIEDSEIYRLLYRYFRKLSFVSRPSALVPGPKLSAIPQHLYTDLYFLALHAV
ncbi:MAG: DUF3822 family protein [Saprospiraceae bacterium]|nr:DUF3822 family protein [Saprospiraceae bacterium]